MSIARRISTSSATASLVLVATLGAASPSTSPQDPTDERDSWLHASPLPAGSIFRLSRWSGGWWFFTPEGRPFFPVALAHGNLPPPARRVPEDNTATRFNDDSKAYVSDRSAWMREHGFNAFSYTNPENDALPFPWIATLNTWPGFISDKQTPTDPFDPAWRETIATGITRQLERLGEDRRLLGISLALPVLASPHMMPPWGWDRLGRAVSNPLRDIKAFDRRSPGKRVYIEYLRNNYETVEEYLAMRGVPDAGGTISSWEDLLDHDLGRAEDRTDLHPDDANFYTHLWSDLTAFLAAEVRRQRPGVPVLSPRIIGLRRWPDPWLEAWVRGVGPHVDAFIPELYASDSYLEILNFIGETTGRPSFVGDGLRVAEFNYAGDRTTAEEAESYAEMFQRLLGSPWCLGVTVCEYRQVLPFFTWYARRPEEGRLGLRNPDYSERRELSDTFKRLHFTKYQTRLELLRAAP